MNKILLKRRFLGLFKLPFLRSFVTKWGHKCTILYFHRVIDDKLINLEGGPNRSLCVSKSFFESLIKYLCKKYTIIALDDLKDKIKDTSNKKYLCITFDDGYKDNFLNAVPILNKNNVPATFYITNDFIDRKGNIWWYEIWDLIKNSYSINFVFKKINYSYKTDNQLKKIEAFKNIRKLIMSLELKDINELLKIITKRKVRKKYSSKFMTWEEIKEIDNNFLFTIGCHTLSHPILKNECHQNAHYQILTSKKKLEKNLNHQIKHLAFPFGGPNEVSEKEYSIVQGLGFETAVTTFFPKKYSNYYYCLPRVAITDYYNLKEIDTRINGLSNFLGLQFG